MKSDTIFTVLIPYYSNNRASGELYLKRAIDSVIAQTEKRWHVYVVDDRSPIEGVEAFVKSFNDPRISYVLNEKNLGQAGNWNRSLELLETEFFSFLHADDELKPNYIEVMYQALKRDPETAAVFCKADIINEHEEVIFSFVDLVKTFIESKGTFILEGDKGLAQLMKGNFIMCPTVAYRHSKLGDLKFNAAKWHTIPDFFYWGQLLLNDRRMTGIPDVLFRYRRHSESGTDMVRKGTRIFEDESEFYDWVATHAQVKNWKETIKVARAKRMVKLRTWYFLLQDLFHGRMSAVSKKLTFLNGIKATSTLEQTSSSN
jgi:glycosyltransferase involved in cell wall biosynthesis